MFGFSQIDRETITKMYEEKAAELQDIPLTNLIDYIELRFYTEYWLDKSIWKGRDFFEAHRLCNKGTNEILEKFISDETHYAIERSNFSVAPEEARRRVVRDIAKLGVELIRKNKGSYIDENIRRDLSFYISDC